MQQDRRGAAPRDAPRMPDVHGQSGKNDIRPELRRPLDGGIVKLRARHPSRHPQDLEIGQALDALRRHRGLQPVVLAGDDATLDEAGIGEALPRHGHFVDLGRERRIDGSDFHTGTSSGSSESCATHVTTGI